MPRKPKTPQGPPITASSGWKRRAFDEIRRRGWSQKDVARMLGGTQSGVSQALDVNRQRTSVYIKPIADLGRRPIWGVRSGPRSGPRPRSAAILRT